MAVIALLVDMNHAKRASPVLGSFGVGVEPLGGSDRMKVTDFTNLQNRDNQQKRLTDVHGRYTDLQGMRGVWIGAAPHKRNSLLRADHRAGAH